MSDNKCAECGCDLQADLGQDLCPDCLLKAGLEPDPSDPFAPTYASDSSAVAESSDTHSIEELNQLIPQLEIEKLLGRGGMGAVYRARQTSLDRVVALKIINRELLSNAALVDRFAREAKALARLNHPNIVGVHDFGNIDGLCYLVMEYVDGTDLRQLLASKQVEPQQALEIVPQICSALQYAHDQGIVHRDIKPENILIDQRGQIKIADFGLAKLLRDTESPDNLTTTRQVMGTLKYMAPEQMEGSALIDHRADIYSLGVVFYELLTGEVPLGRFAAPSQKAHLDNRLDEIVMRALERDLPNRYQQASDLQIDLEQVSSSTLDRAAVQDFKSTYAPTRSEEDIPTAQLVSAQSDVGSPENLRPHIRIIAGLNIVFGILFLVIGLGVFLFLTSIGIGSGEREAALVLSSVGGITVLVMLALGLPGLLVGIGLWRYHTWARYGALVLAVLNLANFPLGTLLSVYTGWALLHKDANALFES